ncbi:phosphoribosyltransferase [Culicoidibacter larvae]|uniref:ComF family protein n=1 Tax=Culicoidibacter larvae TaxID=2579976 RepID=A0A5R8QBK1_9FIRM|nr:hypothetical protein [Culicoidibacter larvae]TLG72708.1 hypothetical protein FEZ08_08365 [Culicoidibacter larvae]
MNEFCHICLCPITVDFQLADLLMLPVDYHLCKTCQKIFELPNQEEMQAGKYSLKQSVLVEHKGLFTYNKYTRNYLSQLNTYGDCAAALPAAQSLKHFLQPMVSNAGQGNICLVPIPKRADIVHACGFELMECLLGMAGFMPSLFLQAGENGAEQGNFETDNLPAGRQFLFCGQMHAQVILVDDIYQSGATMLQARKLCEKNQCKVLQTVSIFR